MCPKVTYEATPMYTVQELSPNESASFNCQIESQDDEKRFIAAVIDLWTDWIPARDRQQIHAHFGNPERATLPRIGLCAADRMEWCIAQANVHGTMFFVNSAVAFKLPGGETALKQVIVHELAHCFLIATADKSHDNPGAVKDGKSGVTGWKPPLMRFWATGRLT
jgi:hypothetical protein